MLRTVFWKYSINTLILSIAVVILTICLGSASAWLMAWYDFPGKKLFEIFLVLPLALPAYISAYAWSGIFDYGGRLREFLSILLPPSLVSSIHITNIHGAIFVLGMSLYPYVYFSLSSTMAKDALPQLQAAQSLGTGPVKLFFTMALPMSRTSLAAGGGLVLMEVLNEYGALHYYGVDTLTVGIFRSWFHFYDLGTARRIGSFLLLYALLILGGENRLRRGRKYFQAHDSRLTPKRLKGTGLAWAYAFLVGLVGLSVLAPMAQLVHWSLRSWHYMLNTEFLKMILNTLALALTATLVCLIPGLLVAYARKIVHWGIIRFVSQIALLGYAIPGPVIALEIMQISGATDRLLSGGKQLILSGSIIMLIFAYTIRYIALAQRPLSGVLEGRYDEYDLISRSLGFGGLMTLLKVHLGNMKGILTGAGLVCFLDIVRELPLTMILRPFNLNTLAVRTYELAANEQLAAAAIPAITLVTISAICLLFITKKKGKWNEGIAST